MAVCTFFGHRDCPDDLYVSVHNKIEDLVLKNKVDLFFVGNQGNFDAIVRKALKEIKSIYPYIRYYVVLAYMPKQNNAVSETEVYPCSIMRAPKRYAISWRNKWMVRQADFVITYVKRSYGGAAYFSDVAKKSGKRVFNLAV